MTITLLTCISMVFLWLYFASIYKNKDIFLLVGLAFGGFIVLHIITSSILLWGNNYSNLRAGIGVATSSVLAFVFSILRNRGIFRKTSLKNHNQRGISVSFNPKYYVIPLAVFFIVLPFIINKFGPFGTGQDEGGYQMKAMMYLSGFNSNITRFDVVNNLTTTDAASFLDLIQSQLFALYHLDGTRADFVMHGVYSYSALLGSFGEIFTARKMAYVNTFIFASSLILFYNILRRLRVGYIGSACMSLIYAFSPLIIWIGKSTLSENVLILTTMGFIYMVIDSDNPKVSATLSALSVAAFAFVHISIYAILPIFIVIYILQFFLTGRKYWLVSNIIVTGAFMASYQMMKTIALRYTKMNYKFVSGIGINPDNADMLIFIAVVAVIGISIVLMFIKRKCRDKDDIKSPLWFKIIFGVIARLLTLGAGYIFIKQSMKAISAGYMTGLSATSPFAYMAAVGVISLLVVVIFLFIYPEMLLKSRKVLVCGLFYFYTVLLFACIFHPSVTYYYYYSRYIVQYIFIILVMFGIIIEKIRWSYPKYGIYIITSAIAAYLFLPYDKVLKENEDDTRISYNALEEVMSQFKKGDAVIVQPELMNQVFYPLETATEATVYTVLDNDLKHTVKVADNTAENVYFISGDWEPLPGEDYKEVMGLKLYGNSLEKYVKESDNKDTRTKLITERVKSIDSYVSYIVKNRESKITTMPYSLEHGNAVYTIRIDKCIIEH